MVASSSSLDQKMETDLNKCKSLITFIIIMKCECVYTGPLSKTVQIKIRLAKDKQCLEIKDMMLDHNHDLSPKVFMNLPRQRRLDEKVSL